MNAHPGQTVGFARSGGHPIGLSGIAHSYGEAPALSGIDLTIEPGELLALLGPSGCGKTTLLKIIAGFVTPTKGDVLVDGESVVRLPAAERNVGIVFQNYALFPHMTVARNIGYGLRARHATREATSLRVTEMLALVKMEAFADRYPAELSGGQQQRVALARALAVKPRIMLLDEPFSALDRGLRLDMQIEVKSLLKGYGVTSILVTHDQEEALSMADRIVVLREGCIEQVGSAADLYDRPRTLFVNRFLGQTNLLPGQIDVQSPGYPIVALDCGARIEIPDTRSFTPGQRIALSVRPENLRPAGAGADTIPCQVKVNVPLGAIDVTEFKSRCGAPVKISRPHRMGSSPLQVDTDVHLRIENVAACSVFPFDDFRSSLKTESQGKEE